MGLPWLADAIRRTHLTFNQVVVGSIPTGLTNKINKIASSAFRKIGTAERVRNVGMGVLTDGTPFLNQRGLARMCGVQNAHIGTIGTEWDEPVQKPRILAIKRILASREITVSAPFIPVKHGSVSMSCYPDFVCLAILEYYAFDAGPNIQKEAQDKYRWLAGRSLREIIYTQLGYNPATPLTISRSVGPSTVCRLFTTTCRPASSACSRRLPISW